MPSAQALEWQNSGIWDSDSVDRAFDSGSAWFTAGPSWMMNALPGSRFAGARTRHFLNQAGDPVKSTIQYNGYVGTLRDAFDVSLFNNVSTFGGTSGSKSSGTPTIALDATAILWSSVGGSAWLTGTNWTGSSVPTAAQIAEFGVNPTSGATGVGINLNGATNNGANNQAAGAIYVDSNRAAALIIGDSSDTPGTLTLNGVNVNTIDNVILRNNSGQLLTLQNTQGGSTGAMSVALGNAANNIINIDSTGGITISSVIKNGAGSKLTLGGGGAGVLTLSGANLFTGGVTINSGTLRAGSTTALGPAANAKLTFDTGASGKFQLNGFDTTIIALFTNGGTGAIIENGSTTTNATLTDNTSGSDAFAGILQNGAAGTLALTKSGNGILLLQNVNTYTGDTTINAGTLEFLVGTPGIGGSSNNSTIRLGSTATNSAAATLSLGDDASGNTLTSPLIVQASQSGTQGTRLLLSLATSGHTNTYGGNITLNADLTMQSATGGTLLVSGTSKTVDLGSHVLTIDDNGGNVNTQGNVTIADQIIGSGGSIVKSGPGTLLLQNTGNSYTGGTQISGGTVGIYNDLSLGAVPVTPSVNVQFTGDATLQDTANNVSLASNRGISIASTKTATFDSNGNTFTINGVISGGGGNLNKAGAGTLVLTGNNTYTGTTLVSAGTLNAAATGALGGTTGSITVNRGGTLLVSGNGNLDRINNSTPIVLGSATGTGTATFQRGTPTTGTVISEGVGAQRTGPLPTDLTGTSLAGLGALSLQSNATFDFGTTGVGTFTFGTFTANANTLTILNWTSSAVAASFISGVDGTDDRLIFSGAPTDIGFINFNGTPATFILLDTGFYEVVPIPEASTWIGGALALGAIGVMGRGRFRKKLKL